MTRPTGFLEHPRRGAPKRPVDERVADYREVPLLLAPADAGPQAGRCMACAVPFCHDACPLHNLVPEWNDLVSRGDWDRAYDRLDLTNNFPEFTGRLCPAPCEPACVLAIGDDPVAIKDVENFVIEHAFESGLVRPRPPAHRTATRVAVVGSGPAGLAAAQQLNRLGHRVTVFERADRCGGLLRYGIPDFKIEKWVVDRRLEILVAEGIAFETGCEVGRDVTAAQLESRFDAVVLAVGAEQPRDLELPGRRLGGVHAAMEYLVQQNRRVAGDPAAPAPISAAGKHVVIIGAGDTAADCLGNVLRERCASVAELSIYDEPPVARPAGNEWPDWPKVLRTYPAHEEGGRREWGVMATALVGDHDVAAVEAVRVMVDGAGTTRRVTPIAGTEHRLECNLVLLAVGFVGVASTVLDGLGLTPRPDGTLAPHAAERPTPWFAAGDAVTGAELIVTAIADGRRAAEACHAALSGVPADAPSSVSVGLGPTRA